MITGASNTATIKRSEAAMTPSFTVGSQLDHADQEQDHRHDDDDADDPTPPLLELSIDAPALLSSSQRTADEGAGGLRHGSSLSTRLGQVMTVRHASRRRR